ncbi:GntR family transcriptional regulator [Variovorax sp. NFACC27]|uniref:GntR family transcriptional regulator n=1 Tax=unclassified Variovorax TaxID=663243 RepID=UPI00089B5BB4|nr:DNA-binding transcriptional regulator, GntR family [Variovorax sp. NFACC28]SEG70283.1 DNA-binding transcriptional regulator, GntR family [Variovorax sp. NFACC29]SFC82921.1 DNA-binding transcriptional regulator, GntR family [Variovorax sp. NFACC26]SFF98164.1 DNA-binding transcriptional regulator, GntR family [Variovorax sp. NFACC27]
MTSASAPSSQPLRVDDVARRLQELIFTGELAPGDKLGEQALADRFGTGRGPLREAIRTLEGRRILERTPNAGVRVVKLSVDDLEQILMTREALEGMACRLAAENMTLREVNDLRACLSTNAELMTMEGLGAVYRDGTQDNDFHSRLVKGSRNLWLSALLCRDLYGLLQIYRMRSARSGNRLEAAHAEHCQILDAVQARDPDEAERRMRAHIRRGREQLLDEANNRLTGV